ncbi:sigma-70 family RNA polymerase sigma factor [Kitasatospora sp. NPDC002227]|uniref:RNA polymerase sigma factor n=1 Tax=Kitasatospora sp. NPDC002227 TaxID=3154773 RepID=UPI00332D691F
MRQIPLQHDPVGALGPQFAVFFEEQHRRWLPFALDRLGNKADAQDAVQNTGAKLFEKWDVALGLPSPEAIQAFAWKILRDEIANLHRSRRRQDEKAVHLARQPRPDTTGHEAMDQLVELDALRWAIDELAKTHPVQAEVVRLRRHEMDYAQIGAVLDIAQSTAKTYYSLATRHLEHLLTTLQDDEQQGN